MKNLTEREKEVVGLVVTGLTNAEISEKLGITRNTVTAHMTKIFIKCNVRNRTELARMELMEKEG
jgi:DNA-binding CsgD family transcriptional regulator